MANTLRVRARGAATVPDYEAQEAGVRRFVGRKWAELEPGLFGWVPVDADAIVPMRAEYVDEVKAGCLWAADAETAAACGVPFNPSFGAPVDPVVAKKGG